LKFRISLNIANLAQIFQNRPCVRHTIFFNNQKRPKNGHMVKLFNILQTVPKAPNLTDLAFICG